MASIVPSPDSCSSAHVSHRHSTSTAMFRERPCTAAKRTSTDSILYLALAQILKSHASCRVVLGTGSDSRVSRWPGLLCSINAVMPRPGLTHPYRVFLRMMIVIQDNKDSQNVRPHSLQEDLDGYLVTTKCFGDVADWAVFEKEVIDPTDVLTWYGFFC